MAKATTVSAETFLAEQQLAERLNEEETVVSDLDCGLGEHPEGHKRGGYVPVYVEQEARVFYDQTAGEWFAYDDES